MTPITRSHPYSYLYHILVSDTLPALHLGKPLYKKNRSASHLEKRTGRVSTILAWIAVRALKISRILVERHSRDSSQICRYFVSSPQWRSWYQISLLSEVHCHPPSLVGQPPRTPHWRSLYSDASPPALVNSLRLYLPCLLVRGK